MGGKFRGMFQVALALSAISGRAHALITFIYYYFLPNDHLNVKSLGLHDELNIHQLNVGTWVC